MKILTIFFLLGFVCLSIFSWLFVDPNLIYLKTFYTGFYTQRTLVTSIYFFLISLVFISFWILNSKERNYSTVKNIIVILCIILFFSYPAIFSFDIFNYIATAKVTFLYHENPYIMMPIEFLGDPLLLFMHAANKIALYGPFWILLTGIPFLLGFGNFIGILILFRIAAILFFLATLKLIFSITKRVESVVFFALNPLVLIELLVSVHNDVVMMFLGIASIWLLVKKKIFTGIVIFALSVLIKYSTIFLLPVVMYLIYSHIVKKKINIDKIFLSCFILMFTIFLLSFIREEIYPWYFVWPLSFAALLTHKKILKGALITLSYGMMLRYIPFMLTGSYFGLTPVFKTTAMILPPLVFGIFVLIKRYAK